MRLPDLERDTIQFVRAFCAADIPDAIKEAALFNLSTLRSQTGFRSAEGGFYGFEGCFDDAGAGFGTCTHVWNYEHATAFLFGDLARGMREVEFNESTGTDGHMEFRAALPRGRASDWGLAAADGQLGCLVKLYRDWQLSGDDEFLSRAWPGARRALEFCWIEGGWDADRDGVMEGCQHNTMDVEYFGPNPRLVAGIWPRCARGRRWRPTSARLSSPPTAAACSSTGATGSIPTSSTATTTSIRSGRSPTAHASPPACAGPSSTRLSALRLPSTRSAPAASSGSSSARLPPGSAASARARSRPRGRDAALNHALQLSPLNAGPHEPVSQLRPRRRSRGLVIAAYPRGDRPDRPFPYSNEVWSGLEYTPPSACSRRTSRQLPCK